MKIGICTGGGDCPGLNAAIRAFVKTARDYYKFDVIGIRESINGLLGAKPLFMPLSSKDVSGIQERGGTILGTSNLGNPFKSENPEILYKNFFRNWKTLKLDGLAIIGGDGTQRIAGQLQKRGANIVGIPKTIDNDFSATDLSIGHLTSMDTVAECISRLHSTAEAHSRAIVVEVMGRDAGFIALNAGIASAAHIILIPEIPFSYAAIEKKIKDRMKRGRNFSIIVAAEGAHEKGKKPEFRSSATGSKHLGGIADSIAREIFERIKMESRVTVLGHIQRGGRPIALDRLFASLFATHAVELMAEKKFGRVVTFKNGKIDSLPYSKITNSTCDLGRTNPLIEKAKKMGICLGE